MAVKRRNTKRRVISKRRTKKSRKRNSKKSSFQVVLQKIKKLKPTQRVQAMKLANSKFINDMSRQVAMLKHVHVSPNIEKRLKRQSKNLNKFINRKTTVATKRRMLTQRGGFLPLLLAALPAIGSIVGGIINRL